MSIITAEDLCRLDKETLIKPSDDGWLKIDSDDYNTFKSNNLYEKTYITCAFLIKLNSCSEYNSEDYYVLYYGNLGDTLSSKGYEYGDDCYTIIEGYIKPTIRIWKYTAPGKLPTANDCNSPYTKEQIQEGSVFRYNPFLFGCKWLDRSSDSYITDYSQSYGVIVPHQNSYVVFKIDSLYYIFKLSKDQNYWANLEDGITIVGLWSQLETSENYSLNKISDQLYSYLERNYSTTSYNSRGTSVKQLVVKINNNSKYLFYAKPDSISGYTKYFESKSLFDSFESTMNSSSLFNSAVLGDTSEQFFIAFQSSNMRYFYAETYNPTELYPDNLSQLSCFYTLQNDSNDDEYFFINGSSDFNQGDFGFLSNNTITRKIKCLSNIKLNDYSAKKQTPYFWKEMLFTDLSSQQQQNIFSTKIWPYKKNSSGEYEERQSDTDNSSCIIGPYINFYLYNKEIKLPRYYNYIEGDNIYNQLIEDYSSNIEKTSYSNLKSNSIYSANVPLYTWNTKYLKYFGDQSQTDDLDRYKYNSSKNFIELTTSNPKYLGLIENSHEEGHIFKLPQEKTSYSFSDESINIQKNNNVITISYWESLSSTSYTINSNKEDIIICLKRSEYTKNLLTSIYNSNLPDAIVPTTREEYQNQYFGAYSCWGDNVQKQRTYNWQSYSNIGSTDWGIRKTALYSGATLKDTPSFSWNSSSDPNGDQSNLLGLYINSYYEFYKLIPEKLEDSQELFLETDVDIPNYLEKITDNNYINRLKTYFKIQTKTYNNNQKLDFETVNMSSAQQFNKCWSESSEEYRFYIPTTKLYLSGRIDYTNSIPEYAISIDTSVTRDKSAIIDYSILNCWFTIKFNFVVMPMRRISLVNPYVNYTSTSPNTTPIWDRSTDFYYGNSGNTRCLNRPYAIRTGSLARQTGFNIGINFTADSTINCDDFMPTQYCPWGMLSIVK